MNFKRISLIAGLILSAVGIIVFDILLVSESLALPETCLLWSSGRLNGWLTLIVETFAFNLFLSIPGIIAWCEYDCSK